jgi:hypothetical protein
MAGDIDTSSLDPQLAAILGAQDQAAPRQPVPQFNPSGPQPQSGPPTLGRPILLDFIQGMLNPKSQQGPPETTNGITYGGRPASRLDVFEKFLGNFMYAFSQGMAQGGTGPGANVRGAGAAMQAPYQLARQQYQLGQQQQLQQAQVQREQAQTELTRAQAGMVQTPYGYMPLQLAKAIWPAEIRGETAQSVAKTQAQGRVDVQQLKNASPLETAQAHLANATADLREAMNDPSSPAFQLALKKVEWANYYKRAGIDLRQQSLDLARQRLNFQQTGPTQNIRTQGQMAGALLEHVPIIKQEIASLGAQGKLGPLQGRWSEFMAGKVGEGDPDYVKLRTDLGLFQTALMKAHVGARGSEFIMKHFQNLVDSGQMSPESLDAAVDSISGFLNTYVRMGQGGAGASSGGSSPLAKLKAKYGVK